MFTRYELGYQLGSLTGIVMYIVLDGLHCSLLSVLGCIVAASAVCLLGRRIAFRWFAE